MFLNILLLIVGFILLIKGADVFVDGASSTAQNFKVSKMLIGLTIVAFGTSAPEFAVSVSALASGSPDMVIGNVIGSCILNILLILGVAAVIRPIKIKANTVKKELPLCLMMTALLAILFLDTLINGATENAFTRSDALAVVLFFCVFLYYLVTLARQSKENKTSAKDEKPQYGLVKSLLLVLVGLAGVIIGSEMVVQNSTAIATAIGWSERLISLTIVAFGTSLPELVTTIVGSRKGEQDLVVGNIIGSNIFNICIVLGVPAAIFGGIAPATFQILDVIALVASAALIFAFAASTRKVSRAEGVVMLIAFVAYYSAIILL